MSLYATPDELIVKWGRVEMARLTTSDKLRDAEPDIDVMVRGLTDASAIADGFLRNRYALPLVAPYPADLVLNVLVLTRYQLSQGGDRTASEGVTKAAEVATRWLRDVAEGKVRLDLPAASAGAPSVLTARVSDRPRDIASGGGLGW